MKGRNNARKTRVVKETLTKLSGGLRPMTCYARKEHREFIARVEAELEVMRMRQ